MIRLIPNGKLVTTLLALIIINVVIILLFVDIIFTMLIYAVLSLRLALFELALSTISLWLMVNFNEHTLDFDHVAAIEQILMAYSDYVQRIIIIILYQIIIFSI